MGKKIIIIICLAFSLSVQAQEDSTHRDSALFFQQGVSELLHAPILRSTQQEFHIVPHQNFCFDVLMEVELNFGSGSRYTALFLNLTDGYIGYTQPQPGGAINVLMPEVESFSFTVISYKLRNIYMYHNQKISGEGYNIEHLVSTSNTDASNYEAAYALTGSTLSRKTERRSYCSDQMIGTAYKANGPTVWYISGGDNNNNHWTPATLQVQKIIGAWGVGLIQTDAGPMIVLEQNSGRVYTRVISITNIHDCFDPNPFKLMESDFYTKMRQNINDETVRIQKDADNIDSDDPCYGEKMQEIQFRRDQQQVQQQQLQRAQSGNLLQNNTAQAGMLSFMDPETSVQAGILSAKSSLCTVLNPKASNRSIDMDKANCLRSTISTLEQTLSQMQQIDRQYSNPTEALVRKNQLYATVLKQIHCD